MFREKNRWRQDPHTVRGPLVFVCSWSDFFVAEADSWRNEAWEIIKNTPELTFQILTKRPERIAECLPDDWEIGYPNVWLGVTAENQALFYSRVKILSKIPAEVRFVSIEPMLEPVSLQVFMLDVIDWVIAGGESGPNPRKMEVDWARKLRDECSLASVPFFFKQMTGKAPIPDDLNIREFPAITRKKNE
jgi:protein gp37